MLQAKTLMPLKVWEATGLPSSLHSHGQLRGDAQQEVGGGVSEPTVPLPPRPPPSDLEASLPLRPAPVAPLQEPAAAGFFKSLGSCDNDLSVFKGLD